MDMPTLTPKMVITICAVDNGWVVRVAKPPSREFPLRAQIETQYCRDTADIANWVAKLTEDLTLGEEQVTQ